MPSNEPIDLASVRIARGIRSSDVTRPSYNDRFQTRVGSGLSPQLITSVMAAADIGYTYQWADLLDEIRQADPHLHGELFKREQAVAGAPLEFLPPPKSGKRGQKAADYCAEIVDSLDVPAASLAVDFRTALAHLLTANWHGRAACEVTWARDGRSLRPARLDWIHARRLAYSGHDWKLYLWDATTGETEFSKFPGVAFDDPSVFPSGKLIVHTPRLFGTYPTREGLGRALVWFAAFKRWSIRDWLAFAEWAGRGLRIGKYASGNDPKNPARASPEDRQVLDEALDAMSSACHVSVPDTTEIDVRSITGNNEVHERLLLACNNEISKATLGGTLTSDPGERGARSLGEIHDSVRRMIATADAGPLAAAIRRDLFMPACAEKFGDPSLAPRLSLVTEPRESQDSLADRVGKLSKAGVRIPAPWVREQLGIPDPADGEEVVGAAAPTEAKSEKPEPQTNAPPEGDVTE